MTPEGLAQFALDNLSGRRSDARLRSGQHAMLAVVPRHQAADRFR
jgi:hypothetical protein